MFLALLCAMDLANQGLSADVEIVENNKVLTYVVNTW